MAMSKPVVTLVKLCHSAYIPKLLNTCLKSGQDFNKVDSSKRERRSADNFLGVRSAILFVFMAIAFPNLARSQSVFYFSKEVHMGGAVLPPGDYVITSMDVNKGGAVLTFAPPNSPPAPSAGAQALVVQEGVSGGSADGGFFSIHNPHNQAMPYAEAEMIYLSACRVVEQEFRRSDPIPPRLSLLLGSDTDRVYYPKREIQLRKWDKYRFAEGVVILAVDSLLPPEEKQSLSKLAVVQSDSIVDVREMKISRNSLRAEPRN
jgi:hypothetical protein